MITLVCDGVSRHTSTDSDALRAIAEIAVLHEMENRDLGSTREVSAVSLNRAVRDLLKDAKIRDRVRHAAIHLVNETRNQ